MPNGVSAYVVTCIRHCSLALIVHHITKWVALASIHYLQSEVIEKNCQKCCLQWLWVEFLENSLSKDHKISHIYQRQSASQTCRRRHHQLLPVDIYCIKVRNNSPKCRFLWLWAEFYWCCVLTGPTNWWASCYNYHKVTCKLVAAHSQLNESSADLLSATAFCTNLSSRLGWPTCAPRQKF